MEELFKWFKMLEIPSEYDNKSIDDAKKLASDASWLKTKRNEMIYIPCHCLSLLPVDLNYKLIVLEEDSAQVIDALKKIHKRDFKEKEFPLELLNKSKNDQDKIDAWIASQANLPVLILHSESLKTEEEEQAEILRNFINFD
jgi:hypothetical protein